MHQLQQRRRRQQFKKVSAGVVCLAVMLLAGLYALPQLSPAEPSFGGIVCSDVQQMADDYIAGHIDEVTAARIDAHLKACDHCREMMSSLQETSAAALRPPETDQSLALVPTRSLTLVAQFGN